MNKNNDLDSKMTSQTLGSLGKSWEVGEFGC